MDPRSLARQAFEVATLFSRFGEVIAGTPREHLLLNEARSFLDGYCDDIRIEYVPVTSWEEELCIVEANGFRYVCALQPPIAGVIDVEAPHVVVDARTVVEKEIDLRGCIAVIKDVEDPDDYPLIASKCAERGALGVVILDRWGTLRRIVTIRTFLPTYREAEHVPIPVVVVAHEAYPHEGRTRIFAKARVYESHGANLVCDAHQRYENFLYVTAHHDHWFSGFSDNLLGVSIVLVLARHFRKVFRCNTRFVLFTAEEGFPSPIASFYWLVGSRYHVLKNIEFILENVLAVLNFDTILRGKPKVCASGVELQEVIRGLFPDLELDFDQIIFDSFSFSSIGIPSLTVQTFEEVLREGIYHSSMDTPEKVSMNTIEQVFALIHAIAKTLDTEFLFSTFLKSLPYIAVKRFPEQVPTLEFTNALLKVSRTFNDLPIRRKLSIIKTFNRIGYACYVTKKFFEELGERESCEVLPWKEGVLEVPTNVRYDTIRDVRERFLSIAYALELLVDAR